MGLFIFGLWHTLLFSQQTVVSGRVSDKKGEPLSDVLIQYQNSKMSTKSDSLGNFILSTYYPTDTLIFRLIGYQTQRYKISAAHHLIKQMQPLTNARFHFLQPQLHVWQFQQVVHFLVKIRAP